MSAASWWLAAGWLPATRLPAFVSGCTAGVGRGRRRTSRTTHCFLFLPFCRFCPSCVFISLLDFLGCLKLQPLFDSQRYGNSSRRLVNVIKVGFRTYLLRVGGWVWLGWDRSRAVWFGWFSEQFEFRQVQFGKVEFHQAEFRQRLFVSLNYSQVAVSISLIHVWLDLVWFSRVQQS